MAILLALGGGTAAAQEGGGGHSVGLGVEQNLGGLTAAAFVYDMGSIRFDILFSLQFADQGPGNDAFTQFGFGGRIAYVLHRAGMADFSIGGGLGIVFASAGASEVNVQLEGFGQARVFLAPNFAIFGSLGMAVVIADDANLTPGPVIPSGRTGFGIGGQILGILGFTYFFRS